MLNILICEDDKQQREKFIRIVKDVILIEDFDMELALATGSPDELISYISENSASGLYFLDIDLKSDVNGIELATEIRKYDPRGFIVFVTTHAEMSYLTFLYKVEALDYIIKDDYKNVRERVHQCIVDANIKHSTKMADSPKIFSVKVDDKIINMELNKILFFETSSKIHKIIIHAIDRQVEFYSKMKDIENSLDSRFYRCHGSYIVNKNNIKEVDTVNRTIHMINGEECIVSTRLLKGLVK